MLTVLHASDLQCGRPFRPEAAEAFLRCAEATAPDVVVVSGDLTQRAKDREYMTASRILDGLPSVPCVVTPGNHDVPLYRVWERLFAPYMNWRRRISPDLDSVTRVHGATIVALNSSAPRRAIVNGRVDAGQVAFARRAFATTPASDIRMLVVHHHFVALADGRGGRPLPRAAHLIAEFEGMDVDLVLGGHVHQTHVKTSRDVLGEGQRPGPGIPLIACGTTTSGRGRGPEAGHNSLNVVRVKADEVEIGPHVMELGETDFSPREPIVLPRRGAPDTARVSTGEGAR